MQRDSYHSMSTPRHLAFTFFSWPGIFTQEQVWWAEVFLHVVQKQHSARSLHFRGLEFLRDVFIWRSEKQPPCAKGKICLDNRWRLCRSWNFSLQQKSYWRWSQDGGLKIFKETAVLLLCCCYGLPYRPQFSLARASDMRSCYSALSLAAEGTLNQGHVWPLDDCWPHWFFLLERTIQHCALRTAFWVDTRWN